MEEHLTLRTLIDHLQSVATEYPEMLDYEVDVQDENGLMVANVTAVEIANGPWVIVTTPPSFGPD